MAKGKEQQMYKNRLQEYTQKHGFPLPEYSTRNEGFQHAPKFRARVLIDKQFYESGETFPQRKEAEQDAARTAIEHLTEILKNVGVSTIQGDPTYCKLILNDYAVKMMLKNPEYTTTPQNEVRPIFISSPVFNDQVYRGEVGGSKKMAEQLAARAAIGSLLEYDSGVLREIINSKVKIHDRLFKVEESGFDRSNLQIAVKPDVSVESSEKTIVTIPSTFDMKSLSPSANSSEQNKRKRETEYSAQKKMRVH